MKLTSTDIGHQRIPLLRLLPRHRPLTEPRRVLHIPYLDCIPRNCVLDHWCELRGRHL